MRHILAIAAILLSLSAPTFAQEQLKVGNSYSGAIKLSSPFNGVFLALPPGPWLLVSLEDSKTSPINTGNVLPTIKGRLMQTDEKKRITGIVAFDSGNGSTSGWTTPSFCSRKDAFFLFTQVQNRNAREKTCWGVYPTTMGQPAANASQFVRDFHQHAALNNLQKPFSMIVVQFSRSNSHKFLHALYYFSPEAEGFPRSAASTWQKDIVIADAKRVEYLNSKKTWGEQFLSTVEAAFAGRPKLASVGSPQ